MEMSRICLRLLHKLTAEVKWAFHFPPSRFVKPDRNRHESNSKAKLLLLLLGDDQKRRIDGKTHRRKRRVSLLLVVPTSLWLYILLFHWQTMDVQSPRKSLIAGIMTSLKWQILRDDHSIVLPICRQCSRIWYKKQPKKKMDLLEGI